MVYSSRLIWQYLNAIHLHPVANAFNRINNLFFFFNLSWLAVVTQCVTLLCPLEWIYKHPDHRHNMNKHNNSYTTFWFLNKLKAIMHEYMKYEVFAVVLFYGMLLFGGNHIFFFIRRCIHDNMQRKRFEGIVQFRDSPSPSPRPPPAKLFTHISILSNMNKKKKTKTIHFTKKRISTENHGDRQNAVHESKTLALHYKRVIVSVNFRFSLHELSKYSRRCSLKFVPPARPRRRRRQKRRRSKWNEWKSRHDTKNNTIPVYSVLRKPLHAYIYNIYICGRNGEMQQPQPELLYAPQHLKRLSPSFKVVAAEQTPPVIYATNKTESFFFRLNNIYTSNDDIFYMTTAQP